MRIVGIGALLTSLVFGFLAITQISDLEDTLESLTSGALQSFVNNMTFFVWVLLSVIMMGLIAGVVWFIARPD